MARVRLGQRWECQNSACRKAMRTNDWAYKDYLRGTTLCVSCYAGAESVPTADRKCVVCAVPIGHKPESQITCSRKCGAQLRAQNRRAAELEEIHTA